MREDRKQKLEKFEENLMKSIDCSNLKNLSTILFKSKESYKNTFKDYVSDTEQSWRAYKGRLLEKIILKCLEKNITKMGMKIIKGDKLLVKSKDICLDKLKRSIAVDFGEFGLHLPDVDLIVYDPQKCSALFIVSVKSTLRERIAQTAYWSIKLKQSEITKGVKVIFITLDEDGDLVKKYPPKKGRAIVENDVDLTYIVSEKEIEESSKVKRFEMFFNDLIRLIKS